MNTRIRKHVLVSGRVQGVYYRQSLAIRATELQALGWCRNLPDGRVEAMVEADATQMEALLVWMQQGPPHALVEHLEVLEAPASEMLPETFEIRRTPQ